MYFLLFLFAFWGIFSLKWSKSEEFGIFGGVRSFFTVFFQGPKFKNIKTAGPLEQISSRAASIRLADEDTNSHGDRLKKLSQVLVCSIDHRIVLL